MDVDQRRLDRERELIAAGMDEYRAREVVAIEAGDADGCCLPATEQDDPADAPRSGPRGRSR